MTDCPRCVGLPHGPFDEDPSLCETCRDQLLEIAQEEAAEDRARELAEDIEFWGSR